jgi:tetratricopeptide (TPR) repeat protein
MLRNTFFTWLAMLLPLTAWAEDVVVFRGGKEAKQTLRRTGTIEDYSGAGLVLKTSAGREETIPIERIIEIQSPRSEEETKGDALARAGKLPEAIDAYRAAQRSESRRWVVRRIMARLVSCYEQQGQIDSAGEGFLALLASDAETPYFSAIPLAWRTSAATPTQAKAWLGQTKEPAAVLLGASWLLSGADRPRAIDALTALSTDLDPRIAQLATAQLWRTKLVTASPDEIDRWQAQLEKLPGELRAGPLLVIGDGLLRHNRSEDALLAYLQVPLVYNSRETLSCEGLFSAARIMDKLKRTGDAARLYRELQIKHPSFAEKNDIESRLQALQSTADGQAAP